MSGRASADMALRTRQNVLRAAADLASVEGLDSVTVGRLADRLQMSKSGVIGPFRSKEALQLETVELVFADFRARVWDPIQGAAHGLARLLAACESWLAYSADPGYPGGCLLTQVTYDYDGRPGAVHDRLVEGRELWRATLQAELRTAVDAAELPASLDIEMVSFGMEALAAFVTPARLLHTDVNAAQHALRAMKRLLGIAT